MSEAERHANHISLSALHESISNETQAKNRSSELTPHQVVLVSPGLGNTSAVDLAQAILGDPGYLNISVEDSTSSVVTEAVTVTQNTIMTS